MGRGYDAPFPHRFTGRALYQLSLVKSSEARRFVPPELRLVELCGYTLGGLYLARYDDSPAGAFDELVALAGLVWNPPGSCAWAARVYVSNADAQRHGVKEVGLPSHTASFEELAAGGAAPARGAGGAPRSKRGWWWRQGGAGGATAAATRESGVVRIAVPGANAAHVCTLALPAAAAPSARFAPSITLCLPSFSGATSAQPALLRYALQLRARVRPCAGAAVATPLPGRAHAEHALAAVLGGPRLLTLAFDDMCMDVGQPERVAASAGAAAAPHAKLALKRAT